MFNCIQIPLLINYFWSAQDHCYIVNTVVGNTYIILPSMTNYCSKWNRTSNNNQSPWTISTLRLYTTMLDTVTVDLSHVMSLYCPSLPMLSSIWVFIGVKLDTILLLEFRTICSSFHYFVGCMNSICCLIYFENRVAYFLKAL